MKNRPKRYADQLQPFMETVFSRIGSPWEHNMFKLLTRPPDSPDLNPSKRLWDVLDKLSNPRRPHLSTHKTSRICCSSLCARYHSTPSEVLWSRVGTVLVAQY